MGRRVLYVIVIVFLVAGCSYYSKNGGHYHDSVLTQWEWKFHKFEWQNNNFTVSEEVNIPHKWPNNSMKTFGFGTYASTIAVPSGIRELGMEMPNIISAYTLYINGDSIFSGGVPSQQQVNERIRIHRDIIKIPDQYYEPGENLDISIRVSNHQYHVGGFLSPLKYGEYPVMIRQEVRKSLIAGIQSGALLLMSVFLFAYYLFRKKDQYILFFSVLSFGLMLRILFAGDHHILDFMPGIDGEVFLKLILLTFYLGITLNYAVLAGLFPKIVPDWSKRIVYIIGSLSIALVLFTPLRIGSYSVPFFQLFSIIAGVVLIIYTFKAALLHQQGAKTVLVGGFIAFILLINDILFNKGLIATGDWSGWGIVIYLFLLIIVISRRFSSAMENEEGLLKQLSSLNRNLERRVRDRTRNLEEYRLSIQKEAESVKAKNEELERFKEDEQTMLRVVVHDLKAPFNKIKGLAQIIRMNNQYKGREEGELNEMILKIAEEGRLLIDDLNVLTMYEAHVNDHQSYEQTSVNDLLEECVKSHAAYAKSKNITIHYHGHHLISSWINPHMLSRIVDNLLSNAIKFSPQNTEVNVELIKKVGEYEIRVSDQGPGFTKDDKKRIFGKFQKLSARPTQGESSTGLGLNIVKNLTELMGGSVSVDSKGEGALFILRFPVNKTNEFPKDAASRN